MASSAVQKAFIKEIAPYAVEAFKALGKVYPSICIGMACVESGYGTSKIMRGHNAFLGQKVGSGKTALTYWSGTFFNARTSEEYTVGKHTAIRDNFRSYVDMRQCVYNYYELLNSSVYKKVMAGVPYAIQMAQIKAAGYMTSSTEVNSVLSVISRYELTKYDTASDNAINIDKPQADSKEGYVMVNVELPVLRRGSCGKHVKIWQSILGLEPDGLYGLATEETTRQFQMLAFPLDRKEWDGVVGAKTWAKGFEALTINV